MRSMSGTSQYHGVAFSSSTMTSALASGWSTASPGCRRLNSARFSYERRWETKAKVASLDT